MGVLLTRRRMLSNASFARLLDFGGDEGGGTVSDWRLFQTAGAVSSGIGRCCVCVRVMAKRCFLRYLKMNRSGSRMKIEV